MRESVSYIILFFAVFDFLVAVLINLWRSITRVMSVRASFEIVHKAWFYIRQQRESMIHIDKSVFAARCLMLVFALRTKTF